MEAAASASTLNKMETVTMESVSLSDDEPPPPSMPLGESGSEAAARNGETNQEDFGLTEQQLHVVATSSDLNGDDDDNKIPNDVTDKKPNDVISTDLDINESLTDWQAETEQASISPKMLLSPNESKNANNEKVGETVTTKNDEANGDAVIEAANDDNEAKEESDKEAIARLEKMVESLELQRGQLTSEVLEKEELISGLERENGSLKMDVVHGDAALKRSEADYEAKLKDQGEEMAGKIADWKKQLLNATREKESMVMKYAMREKDILICQRKSEEAEKKMKSAVKEKDEAVAKMKTAVQDKAKFQAVADSRLQDVNVLRRDIDRWKEEVKIQEAKAASHNSRLRAEVEAHRETREQLDKTIKHLAETRGEIDRTRKECQEFMDKMKSEEGEKVRLETEKLRQQNAKLIIDEAAANELSDLKDATSRLREEKAALTSKIEELEASETTLSSTVSNLNDQVSVQKTEIVDLYAQVAELESLKHRLQSEEEKSEGRKVEIDTLKSDLSDTQADMAACRAKEAELLEFTSKLTEKNATLQSELSNLQIKSSAIEAEFSLLTSSVEDLESKVASTTGQLELERQKRGQETDLLARKLAEKSKQVETLSQQTLDAENEVQVLKRKHASSLRELTRELQRANNSQNGGGGKNMISSRTSSNTSINQVGASSPEQQQQLQQHQQLGQQLAQQLGQQQHQSSNSSSRSNLSCPPQQEIQVSLSVPPDQALVEKMLRLQRTLARKCEKIEFMEEHINTLVEDIKKKNRLIQSYILKQETPGALSSSLMDDNKKKLSEQGGGIMSSLYTSKANDVGMTLELSLEINQKLQAVLEDTLLKNITLKENINTLGNEIANMAKRNQN